MWGLLRGLARWFLLKGTSHCLGHKCSLDCRSYGALEWEWVEEPALSYVSRTEGCLSFSCISGDEKHKQGRALAHSWSIRLQRGSLTESHKNLQPLLVEFFKKPWCGQKEEGLGQGLGWFGRIGTAFLAGLWHLHLNAAVLAEQALNSLGFLEIRISTLANVLSAKSRGSGEQGTDPVTPD